MFERLSAPKHVPRVEKNEVINWASGEDEEEEDDSAGNEDTKQLLSELHEAFVACDEDGNGEMDETEFTGIRDLWLSKVDHEEMTEPQLRHLFLKIDVSHGHTATGPHSHRRFSVHAPAAPRQLCAAPPGRQHVLRARDAVRRPTVTAASRGPR
jgi:Ca2+-binding EF-hand superfamily protein